MKVSIRNFRGLASAEIELSGIALVAGLNGSGKTSLATAVAAALQRTPAPVPGMTKTDARQYLRDHQERGRVLIEAEAGKVQVNYPGGTVAAEGKPPAATPMGCGLLNVAAMNDKSRAAYLIEVMKASPSREDLDAALRSVGVGDNAIESCWKRIDADGWDKTHAYALTRATETKGAWRQITGENWGSQKAADWRPADLPAGDLDPAAYSAAVDKARAHLEAVIAEQAVGSAEVERLKAAAAAATDDLGALQAQLDNLHDSRHKVANEAQVAVSECANARQALAELPKPGQTIQTVECPSCGDHVIVISRTELGLPSKNANDEAENQARQKAIDAAQIQVDAAAKKEREKRQAVVDIDTGIQRLNGLIADARRACQAVESAKVQLASIKTDGTTAEQVQQARDALADAEHRLACLNQFYDASKKHQTIEATLKMAEVLAPTGLRRSVLLRTIDATNKQLSSLCEVAKWGTVTIAEDLGIHYLGRNYELLSAAEQFRVRVTLQVVFSELDGSDALIVDAADILDRPGRSGLIALLLQLSKPALVTMTMSDPKDVPDLSRSGRGRSYWASEATIQPCPNKGVK